MGVKVPGLLVTAALGSYITASKAVITSTCVPPSHGCSSGDTQLQKLHELCTKMPPSEISNSTSVYNSLIFIEVEDPHIIETAKHKYNLLFLIHILTNITSLA